MVLTGTRRDSGGPFMDCIGMLCFDHVSKCFGSRSVALELKQINNNAKFIAIRWDVVVRVTRGLGFRVWSCVLDNSWAGNTVDAWLLELREFNVASLSQHKVVQCAVVSTSCLAVVKPVSACAPERRWKLFLAVCEPRCKKGSELMFLARV